MKKLIRKFIRMEATPEERNFIRVSAEYGTYCVVPIEDWIVLSEKLKKSDMTLRNFFRSFLMTYVYLTEELEITLFDSGESPTDELRKGSYFIKAVADLLIPAYYEGVSMDSKISEIVESCTSLKESGECYKANIGKPLSDCVFPLFAKRRFIGCMHENLDGKSKEIIDLYRKFVEELAALDDITALECKGYGCYGGDAAYQCDWFVSRDIMLRLLEINPDEERKAVYANTLGYIYYYGRCNDKVPEYEKAFKMYSLGAAGGMIESMYKLADMYIGGKGVPQSITYGKNLIRWVYDDSYQNYLYEGRGKIADLALRSGSFCMQEGNYQDALYYALQADYAIRMRMSEVNFYGDNAVFDSIQELLAKAKQKMRVCLPVKSITENRPNALGNAFMNEYVVKIKLTQLKNSVKIRGVRRPKPSEIAAKKIELYHEEYAYYNLVDYIEQYAYGNLSLELPCGKNEFYADYVSHDPETKKLCFTLFDESMAVLTADGYRFKFPKIEFEGEKDY